MKNLKALPEQVAQLAATTKKYLPLLFCLLLTVIYGLLFMQIQSLNTQQPAPADVSTKSTTASVPHVDPTVLKQVQSLQDNSVSVQTLFDNARSNPFE